MSQSTPGIDRNSRFANRRIYVTGAASGIGLATAKLLAREGATLALIDKNETGLKKAAAETGGVAVLADLLDGEAIDRSIDVAAGELGGLDGVVNCAGVPSSAGLEATTPEEWNRVIATNLTAVYRVCRAALPVLRAHTGSAIVNVASGAAILPAGPGAAAYAASKGGVISFTKSLAAEVGPGIRANVICPGVTDTPMTAPMLHGMDPNVAAAVVARYVLKRAAEPREIAEGIAYLLSSEASFITGIVLAVNGGRTFH